jgi:hypothetical protein
MSTDLGGSVVSTRISLGPVLLEIMMKTVL